MSNTDFPETITSRVAQRIAEERDDQPIEIEPLYETVDPESLNTLFRGDSSVIGHDLNQVQFYHAGCCVTVSSDGTITVSRLEGGPAPTTADCNSHGSMTSSESPD